MTDATLPAGGVFISHCHEDNDLVRDLATYLARKGHVVYVDIESLRGGDTLGQAIARFINASSKVVVVLSKIAIGKRWVLTEIEWTLNREINEGLSLLVPYCLDREALDWFRKDTRLGCRLAVLGFGRPKEEALPELAKALAHAAERGVVHRDVRPANVLVRYDGVVKLADFGLARQIEEAGLSRATRRDTDLGRVQYSPPESLGNAAPCDSRSDIYSLGATLYESLAGEKPFPVTTIDDAIREIRTRTPGPFTRSIQRSRRRSRRSSQERWRSAPRTGTPPPVP